MSPSRSVEIKTVDGLSHQKLIEIGDKTIFSDVMEQLERNQQQAIPNRMRAFRDLEKKMASSRDAASAREEIANIISWEHSDPRKGRVQRTLAAGTGKPGRSYAIDEIIKSKQAPR